ncbi:MAG: calcium/sodium antiporter [Clostridiales bacterium]|nr:calcium/sodium antiporter [Clostridiales bacterium]
MAVFLNILFLIVGMALLIKGADFFVSGASAVAERLKVPSLFIGLTIVALGTSLPELSVSITSAINGSIDMSVGNVVGSNLFNMLVVLGLISLFSPVPMSASTRKIDFPFLIVVTAALLLFSLDTFLNGASSNVLSRTESILFLLILVLYLYILISNANRKRKRQIKQEKYLKTAEELNAEQNKKQMKIWQIILCLVLGLAAVVFGGECVSTTAQYLALKMGMSEALVGLTIVAVGTSLPELVTSVVAAKKGENDLALGNVIGSNIMNISLILGSVSLIGQAPVSSVILTDVAILLGITIVFVILCSRKNDINRKEGAFLLSLYIAYIAFAIVRNYCF